MVNILIFTFETFSYSFFKPHTPHTHTPTMPMIVVYPKPKNKQIKNNMKINKKY